MHLGKRYERERMLAACQRALQIGSTSYRSVNAILKNGLDKVPLPPMESESLAKICADSARQPARRGVLPAEPDGPVAAPHEETVRRAA